MSEELAQAGDAAEQTGAEQQTESQTEEAPQTVMLPDLRFGGELREIPVDEAATLISQARDYTQKTQALSDERKNFNDLVEQRSQQEMKDTVAGYLDQNPNATVADVARDLGVDVGSAATGADWQETGDRQDANVMATLRQVQEQQAAFQRDVYGRFGALREDRIAQENPMLKGEKDLDVVARAAFHQALTDPNLMARFGGSPEKAAQAITKLLGQAAGDQQARQVADAIANRQNLPGAAGASGGVTEERQIGEESPDERTARIQKEIAGEL